MRPGTATRYDRDLAAAERGGLVLGSGRRGAAIVLAVALVMAGASALATWVRLSNPTTGAAIPTSRQGILPDGVDIDVAPGATTVLQTGDVVTAIEGRPLDAWARRLLEPGAARLSTGVGDSISVDVRRGSQSLSLEVSLIPLPALPIIISGLGTLSFVFLMLGVAIVVFVLRPEVPAAGAMLIAAMGAAGSTLPFLLSQDPIDIATGTYALEYPLIGLVYVFLWAGLIDFVLVFPRPLARLAQRPVLRLVPYVGLLGAQLAAGILAAASSPTALAGLGAVAAASLLGAIAAFAILPVTILVRWRRGPVEDRRLLRGFAYVIGGIIAADLVIWVVPEALGRPPLLPWTVSGLTGLPFPLMIGAAILRHRAFDIDVVVRRSLVYGGLTLVILFTYAGTAAFLGAIVGSDSPFATSLLATGVATLVALPVRDGLQRAVRRLLYGDRDEPVRAIRRLGERLEASLGPETMPDTVVATVSDALRLPYVALELGEPGSMRPAAARGQPTGAVIERPIRFGPQTLGRLLVSAHGPADPLSSADLRLLDDLCRQVGIAAHAAALTEDLRASRERIVTAREEERRRLRRDLHDGLGPALAAIALRAEAAESLISSDPASSQRLLDELRSEVTGAVTDVRRLVDGLRPPALDELGLVGAVRLAGERLETGGGLEVSVEASGSLSDLPAAIEVAAYRIATEAMTNAVRHAGAGHCRVRLDGGEALTLMVEDDGRGLASDRGDGHGLVSMRERASELGGDCRVEAGVHGGTRVTAWLPLPMGPRPVEP